MKTFLQVWFNADGTKASEVTARLHSMGFKALHGSHDFVYDWDTSKNTVEDTIRLGDQVHATLKGCKVLYKLETED